MNSKNFFHQLVNPLKLRLSKFRGRSRWHKPTPSAYGLDAKGVLANSNGISADELDRYINSRRIYLETSAFNYFLENYDLPAIELTREYQRRKGFIFVASPVLLWEIMLTADPEEADRMLLAAQALFDPLLLATPTELVVRYLLYAYPENLVNYSFFSQVKWLQTWPDMTKDFNRTFDYNIEDLKRKTAPFRISSRNLGCILNGDTHSEEIVSLTSNFVSEIYNTISGDLDKLGVDEIHAKLVILYSFWLLLVAADLDSEELSSFWKEKGFNEELDIEKVGQVYFNFPDIFLCGPLLEMATMVALQYKSGAKNRGIIFDGMHMVYAPYVDFLLSNDHSFLALGQRRPFYQQRVLHVSSVRFSSVSLKLEDYPNNQRLGNLGTE